MIPQTIRYYGKRYKHYADYRTPGIIARAIATLNGTEEYKCYVKTTVKNGVTTYSLYTRRIKK